MQNSYHVRTHNELAQWIKFFLVGISDTAQGAVVTLQKILNLNDHINGKIMNLGKRIPLAKRLLHYLFKFPTITSGEIVEELQITKPTANAIINEFLKLNILSEKTGFKRNRIFVFETYLNLFRD